jgi:hypothetical protein
MLLFYDCVKFTRASGSLKLAGSLEIGRCVRVGFRFISEALIEPESGVPSGQPPTRQYQLINIARTTLPHAFSADESTHRMTVLCG